MKAFNSILEFQKHFDTDEKCRKHLELQRWGDTPACVFCGSTKVRRLGGGKRFQCNEKECKKQFSVTVGSVLEGTKIGLDKWFLAMFILSNHSKGISSLQLGKWLGVSQKTAWFLNHRIREMLTDNAPEQLSGIVEVDESWVGGKISNKHAKQRRKLDRNSNKTMVFGALERGGRVIAKVINDTKGETLVNAVESAVKLGSVMVSDENVGYKALKEKYNHASVNHSEGEYVRGLASTNGIENFWSILKRQVYGIHHVISPQHLQRYVNEVSYRFNNRETPQDERFDNALQNCEGRLKYVELTKNKK